MTEPPDLVRLLARFPFERKVSAVHVHHTAGLRREDWRGGRTLEAIWYAHTRQFGWSDIAQHLTIAPDGVAWTGRDWNRPPCSVPGRNGTRQDGPFMISVVGDFDDGRDVCDGLQYQQLVEAIARVQRRFGLDDQTISFHNTLDERAEITCPGRSLIRATLIAAVRERCGAIELSPSPPRPAGAQPFGDDAEAWYQFITTCVREHDLLQDEPPDVPRQLSERLPGAPA